MRSLLLAVAIISCWCALPAVQCQAQNRQQSVLVTKPVAHTSVGEPYYIQEPGIIQHDAVHPEHIESFRPARNSDLFHNYYVAPYYRGGVPAQMYLSPRPTPAMVGHVYITYQPLMPHEYMYSHMRRYTNYHGDHSMNQRKYTRTSVLYTSGELRNTSFKMRNLWMRAR